MHFVRPPNFRIKCPKDAPFALTTKAAIGVILPQPVKITLTAAAGSKVGLGGTIFDGDDEGRSAGSLDVAPWFATMRFEIRKAGGTKKSPLVFDQVKWSRDVEVSYMPPGAGAEPVSHTCVVDPGGYFGSKCYGLKDGKGVEFPWEAGTPLPSVRDGAWIETIVRKPRR